MLRLRNKTLNFKFIIKLIYPNRHIVKYSNPILWLLENKPLKLIFIRIKYLIINYGINLKPIKIRLRPNRCLYLWKVYYQNTIRRYLHFFPSYCLPNFRFIQFTFSIAGPIFSQLRVCKLI